MFDRLPLDDSQSARTESEDQPARQSRTGRESARGTTQKYPGALAPLPRTAPFDPAARHLREGSGGDEAADQIAVAVGRDRVSPGSGWQPLGVGGEKAAPRPALAADGPL